MKPRASYIALPLLAFCAVPALAFDCSKAKTAVETAICATPELKALDDDLATAYADVKAVLPPAEQKMLVRSQRRWIERREYCNNSEEGLTACIARQTRDRLSLLSGKPESGPGVAGELLPYFIVQDGTAKSYDINLAVLRFAAPQTPGERMLNQRADKVLRAAKLGPHGEQTEGSTYADEEIWSLTYASPQLISVRSDYYEDKGGAHGMYGTFNINIDMASAKLLTLADVLTDASAAVLALECRRQIVVEKTKRFAAADMGEPDGVDEAAVLQHVKTLDYWSIGEKQIVVSFDPYEVGTYAEGAYTCSFPTAGVKRLAIPGAPIP
jgi:uncharacterized protein